MTYELAKPPVDTEFQNDSATELASYADWFLAQLPIRIATLTQLVRETQCFRSWVPDFSEASIQQLGQWFFRIVETTRRSSDDIQELRQRIPDWVELSSVELSPKTISVAFDVGMYFGETLRTNGGAWRQALTRRSDVDYGHMLIECNGKTACNPFGLCLNFAHGVSRGNRGPERFFQLFEYWRDKVKGRKA